jgi:polyisoprenoid-binding protein YceI
VAMTRTNTPRPESAVAPGTWEIDTAHSTLSFVARHLMVTKVRGSFRDFAASITVGDSPQESSASATIQAASIDTREPDRDAHLRSPDFLDAENFPTLDFVSREILPVGDDRWAVHGDLTIRGVTRPVVLEVEFLGRVAQDPWGKERVAFSATTTIDREAWGLTWNRVIESGGVLVSKDVKLELEVTAVRK